MLPPAFVAPRPPAPSAPQPLVRAKGPDEPKLLPPTPLTLPTPEQLGLTVRATQSAGERSIGERAKELGILRYHTDRINGHFRFTCWLPGDRAGVSRCIEALAATEDEAARLALDRASR